MRQIWQATVVSAVLAVAACGDMVAVKRSEIAGGYTGWVWIQTLAQTGTNAVVVRNNPFPDSVVLAALRARYSGGQYRFDLGRPADWNGYTVVIGFGRPGVGIGDLCRGQPLQPAGTNETAVTAAYCHGDVLLTEAQGWTRAITSPDDPRVEELIGGVIAELLID